MIPWINEEDTMHPPRVGPSAPDRNSNIKGGVVIIAVLIGVSCAVGAAIVGMMWAVIG